VVVAMFWSATSTLVSSEDAPKVYPAIVIFQQLGAIGGATLATYTKTFGFAVLFFGQTANILLAVLLMSRALANHERRNAVLEVLDAKSGTRTRTETPPTGFLEGLRLIYHSSYVRGICVISTFAEIVRCDPLGPQHWPDNGLTGGLWMMQHHHGLSDEGYCPRHLRHTSRLCRFHGPVWSSCQYHILAICAAGHARPYPVCRGVRETALPPENGRADPGEGRLAAIVGFYPALCSFPGLLWSSLSLFGFIRVSG
jgi:hypothetical protein